MTEKERKAFSKGKLDANSGLMDMLRDAQHELRTLKSLFRDLSDRIRIENPAVSDSINSILSRDE